MPWSIMAIKSPARKILASEQTMRIDVHAHLWTDEYLDLLIRYGKPSAEEVRGLGADATARDLDARFAMMDAASVDIQVLSASPLLPSFLEESHAAEAARHVNDLYARVVRDHPDRFAAFAALPLPHVEVALHELRRALDGSGNDRRRGQHFDSRPLGR